MRTIIMAAVCALLGAACAQGGRGEGTGDDAPIDAQKIDASQVVIDAPITPPQDAGQDAVPPAMIDAAVPGDAPPGSNLFCAANSQCTIAGECCFTFLGASSTGVCAAGTVVIGVCVPN